MYSMKCKLQKVANNEIDSFTKVSSRRAPFILEVECYSWSSICWPFAIKTNGHAANRSFLSTWYTIGISQKANQFIYCYMASRMPISGCLPTQALQLHVRKDLATLWNLWLHNMYIVLHSQKLYIPHEPLIIKQWSHSHWNIIQHCYLVKKWWLHYVQV